MRRFTKLELLDFKESDLSFDEWLKKLNYPSDVIICNIRKICEVMNTDYVSLLSYNRKRHISDCRIMVGIILVEQFHFVYSKAGEYLNRDHSSITHYFKEHKKLMKYNKKYKDLYIECLSVVEDE